MIILVFKIFNSLYKNSGTPGDVIYDFRKISNSSANINYMYLNVQCVSIIVTLDIYFCIIG